MPAKVNWDVKITWERDLLTKYLARIAERTRRGMAEVLRENAPLLARYIASVSPPMSGFHPGTITKADEKAGRNAIFYDLVGRKSGEGIIGTATASQIREWSKMYGPYKRMEIPKGWERAINVCEYFDYYDPSGKGLKAHHQKHRSKQTGRVTRANRMKAEIKRVGVWKVQDRMYVTPQAFNRYLREVYRKVGSIKGGWYRSIMHYPKKPGWPAWVQKAANSAGSVTDRAEMADLPHIILHNQVAYAANRSDTGKAIARGTEEMRKRIARSVRFKLANTWK